MKDARSAGPKERGKREHTKQLCRKDGFLELALHERDRPLQGLRNVIVRLHQIILTSQPVSLVIAQEID